MTARPMLLLLALALTALAACAGGALPEPVVRTVEVQVPVPQPCDAADRLGPPPVYPDGDEALRVAPDLFEQVRLLVAGRLLRIARGEALEEALRACGR